MGEEFRHHIELHTERLIAEGLAPGEALRRARLAFGNVESHKEAARAALGLRPFDELRFSWIDVKLGLRMLRKYPGLSLVALFALAVGIPAGMAPMHLAQAMDAPLPEDPGNRIRAIRYWDRATSGVRETTAYELDRWREELRSFEKLAAVRGEVYNLAVPASAGAGLANEAALPLLGAELSA
ncbi:MAG: hypothetical protein KDD47_23465 [Acidobacteria bacterium]|nr:hypothetical protein [Acidobacteriota bacterium]